MDRDKALAVLARAKPELAMRFGLARLALFGSVNPNMARPDSDVPVLVSFDVPATSARYFEVQSYLEDDLDYAVDLVPKKSMRLELRPFIEHEPSHV